MTRLVLVGSGSVAEALARAAADNPATELVQLVARNPVRGPVVAALGRTQWTADAAQLAPADLYLLAVSDRAVAEVAASLPLPPGAAIVHTAGGVALDALPAQAARRGVLYPLQTFTAGRAVDFGRVPLFVEGSTPAFQAELEALARTFSPTVVAADSERRARLHLAAVFACNFANRMYALGEEVMQAAGLDFALLKPLIAETASKALDAPSPAGVQTGPAVRHDAPTLERHLRLLAEGGLDARLTPMYQLISEDIWKTSKR